MRMASHRRFVPIVMALLLAVHAGLLAYSATRHSPTMLEPAQLAAGISNWDFGRFELYSVNPPLVRMIAALPVLAVGCKTDWSSFYQSPGARPEFAVGSDFIAANGERSIWLFTIARWACIPISLIGGLFCFFWARELWGGTSTRRTDLQSVPNQSKAPSPAAERTADGLQIRPTNDAAGLIALFLWCFDPNILAHAELINTDAAAAAFGLGAAYTFWRWLRQPSWTRAGGAGLLLGLAQLSKMSWLFLFGLWPLLWLAATLRVKRQASTPAAADQPLTTHRSPLTPHNTPILPYSTTPPLTQLAGMLIFALYLLNLGYAFDGTLTPLGDYTFVSETLSATEPGQPGNRFADTCLAQLPVPVPRQYLIGLDLQKKDFERFGYPSYLRGEWKDGGWWYYYLYALAVKMPHGTQLLLLITLITFRTSLRRSDCATCSDSRWISRHALDIASLLAAPLLLIVIASRQLEFNQHLRYVLPCLGFLFVVCGCCALRCAESPGKRCAVLTAALWTVVSSLVVYPHHLAYFNELAGGPQNGHRHLLDSNVDWGQDLLLYREYVEQSPSPLPLVYYGGVPPSSLVPHSFVYWKGVGGRVELSEVTKSTNRFFVSANVLYGPDSLSPGRSAHGDSLRIQGALGYTLIRVMYVPHNQHSDGSQ